MELHARSGQVCQTGNCHARRGQTTIVLPCLASHIVITPHDDGRQLALFVRARRGAATTEWFPLLTDGDGQNSLVPRQPTVNVLTAHLDIDTLVVDGGARTVEICSSRPLHGGYCCAWWQQMPLEPRPWRTIPAPRCLPVVPRSQMTEHARLRQRICLPTSLAMVLEYWGHSHSTATIAKACYDETHGIYGNWVQACLVATSYGLQAQVQAMERLGQLLPHLDHGRPLIVSLAYGEGELPRAPMPSTKGHLVVVRGVSREGDILCCDPAATSAAQGQLAYPHREFARAFRGVAIVVRRAKLGTRQAHHGSAGT